MGVHSASQGRPCTPNVSITKYSTKMMTVMADMISPGGRDRAAGEGRRGRGQSLLPVSLGHISCRRSLTRLPDLHRQARELPLQHRLLLLGDLHLLFLFLLVFHPFLALQGLDL